MNEVDVANGRMVDAFTRQFGAAPTHIVRAPGRINLIGEHIDYHLLPVLPMAIDREIRLLFRPRDDGTVRAVTLADDLSSTVFAISEAITPAAVGDWSNYVRGAVQSLVLEQDARQGIDLLVSADLPIAAGLSSSSALVVGAGLAIASANGIRIDRLMFAGQMADAERYTGTQGGGMDQAVCLLAVAGHALYLEFHPFLGARPIPLPPDLKIILAHSLQSAKKSGSSRAAYNERRTMGESARKSVALALGLPADAGYGELVGVGEQGLLVGERILSGSALRTFRHVFTEAVRVGAAASALACSDVVELGVLMDASHDSLRTDLLVSTPELDQLVTLAREAGALGARLTGAGFGGSIIALARSDQAGEICDAIARHYYRPRGILDPQDSSRLLVVRASRSATVSALPQGLPAQSMNRI